MKGVAFCSCSYVRDPSSLRARMVRDVFKSWISFLDLPFAEKIFLDDQSPHFAALQLLKASGSLEKFTDVRYQSRVHPPHSNFGIVACMEQARSRYILHLDDDVFVRGPMDECWSLIQEVVSILEADSTIMGCNLLSLDPSIHGKEYLPAQPYPPGRKWSHPHKLFGTSACLIRSDLLKRVPMSQIFEWGTKQPDFWERLVTSSPGEFLTGPLETPFKSRDYAFFYSSTAVNSMGDSLRFEKNRLRRRLRKLAKTVLGGS